MATRFGAASPAQTYAARVRWLVGCLISVILVLVVTILVTSGQPDVEAPVLENTVNAEVPIQQTISILKASVRIEAGTRLMPHLFTEQSIHQDLIPTGAVLGRDKASITGKYAKALISADLPLLRENISESQLGGVVTSSIPPGYRAVTIVVNNRSGVEGWARPNTRVDVLWTYTDKRRDKRVATLVHRVKILSVAGVTANSGGQAKQAAGGTTITLLVTARDAKRIELARTMGQLSLSLVGDEEDTTKQAFDPTPVGYANLLPGLVEQTPQSKPVVDGTMMMKHPRTGKLVRYELYGSKWRPAED